MAEVRTLTNAEYHADFSAVCTTMLKYLDDEGTAAYWEAYEKEGATGPPKKETDHLDIGGLVDALLFDQDELQNFVEIPPSVLTVDGKRYGNAWDNFVSSMNGHVLMMPDQVRLAEMLAEKLRRVASQWLSVPGYPQVSIYWEDPMTGILCRCRPDKLIVVAEDVVYDLKTTESLKRFDSKCKMFKYWLQDVHYRSGVSQLIGRPVQRFVFGAIETTGKHRYREFELDHRTLSNAQYKYRQLLDKLAHCRETGDWGDPDVLEPETLSLYIR